MTEPGPAEPPSNAQMWDAYLRAIADGELTHMAVLVTFHADGTQTHSAWVTSGEEDERMRRQLGRDPNNTWIVGTGGALDSLLGPGNPDVVFF